MGCHIVIDELGYKVCDKTLPNFEVIEGFEVAIDN